ncbi:MAG: hypothetical protein IT580_23540 [Verrucomicrobiales bacterium]|nr:hypothetical protein [Verrucomicrobiales bacterium]
MFWARVDVVDEDRTQMHPPYLGPTLVDEPKKPGPAIQGSGELFAQLTVQPPSESCVPSDSPRQQLVGVHGIDVASNAQRPKPMQPGLSPTPGVSSKFTHCVSDKDVWNPLLETRVLFRLGAKPPLQR